MTVKRFAARQSRYVLLVAGLLLGLVASALAWPLDSEWQILLKGGGTLKDTGTGGKNGDGDASGSSNIVSASDAIPADAFPSAYIYNDGAYLFYRMRLDTDPSGSGGQGILQQFGWGIEIDSDQDARDYEWLLMVDGIASPETVNLQQNTVQGTLGDPSDVAEITVASYPLPGNHRIVMADSSINGDQDYFLDFRIPYNVFLGATGLGPDSMIRYFVGTSKSANNLTDNGADLLGGSDLYNGLGDYLTPGGGTAPCGGYTNGTVMFVNALDGFIDQQLVSPGNFIYIRVDDADQTLARNPSQTISVKVVTARGDSEFVTLSATGVAGKFSGRLATRQGAVSVNSGTLDLANTDEIVTVTYVDAVTATCTQNVNRTDTILSSSAKTDLRLVKTVSNASPPTGTAITYTLEVTNLGPNAVTSDITVNDPQPDGVIFGAVTPPAGSSWAGNVWTIALSNASPLAVGAIRTLLIPATITGTAGSSSINTATLSHPNDGYAGNNTSTATIYVQGTDLRVTKAVSNPTPAIGERISYSVRVFNLGPYPVSGIQLTDFLPAGVTYFNSNATQGTFSDLVAPAVVPETWDIGALAVGSGASLTIDVDVAAAAGTTVTNTASLVTGGLSQRDINSANDSASASFVSGAVDIQVVKTASKAAPVPSEVISYTIQTTNLGPNPASAVILRDVLPAGLLYQSHSLSQGTFTDLVSADGIPETWTVGALAKNATATLTINVQVTATAGTRVVNQASLLSLNQYDINSANNTDTASIEVGGTDLRLVKLGRKVTAPATAFAESTLVQPSDRVEFQLTVTNTGPAAATNIAVTDILPKGVKYVSYTTIPAGLIYDGASNGTKVWTIGNLAVNASATLTIVADVDAGATGTITNIGMVTGLTELDIDDTNNISSCRLVVNGTDLGVTKTVNNATPMVGSDVTYTITLTNYGPIVATNVRVIDLLPPELTYVSSSPATGTTYDKNTGIWDFTDPTGVAVNTSKALTITARVNSYDSNLQIKNAATVTRSDQTDSNPANNSATAAIAVQGTDIALNKIVSTPNPFEGQNFTYTVTATNAGVFSATNIEIEDILPSGLTLVSSTASTGTFLGGLWFIPSLAGNNTSTTLTIVAKANSGTAGASITNIATVRHMDQIDSNAANNTASVSIMPQILLVPSLTFLKISQVVRDQVNDINSPAAIPGADVRYTLQITNFGPGPADGNSLYFIDPIPTNTLLYVGDLTPTSVVTFSDPDTDSGFAAPQPYTVAYSSVANCADYSYVPVPVDGFAAGICRLRINMTGTMSGAVAGVTPDFEVSFSVRIQ